MYCSVHYIVASDINAHERGQLNIIMKLHLRHRRRCFRLCGPSTRQPERSDKHFISFGETPRRRLFADHPFLISPSLHCPTQHTASIKTMPRYITTILSTCRNDTADHLTSHLVRFFQRATIEPICWYNLRGPLCSGSQTVSDFISASILTKITSSK